MQSILFSIFPTVFATLMGLLFLLASVIILVITVELIEEIRGRPVDDGLASLAMAVNAVLFGGLGVYVSSLLLPHLT